MSVSWVGVISYRYDKHAFMSYTDIPEQDSMLLKAEIKYKSVSPSCIRSKACLLTLGPELADGRSQR